MIRTMVAGMIGLGLFCGFPSLYGQDATSIGTRPYEMDWAGRTQNPLTPLVDFESTNDSNGNPTGQMDGWTVETSNAVGTFQTTREQQLWGQFVGKITYRVETKGNPTSVKLVPPTPIALPDNADSVQIWCYGNNWAWAPDAETPSTTIQVNVQSSDGNVHPITMGYVNWQEWFVLIKRFTPEQKKLFATDATFVGLEVLGGQNTQDRSLFFDDLAFYNEPLEPLTFEPRARRNLLPDANQVVGTRTDTQKTLPFPTREATILPTNADREARIESFGFKSSDNSNNMGKIHTENVMEPCGWRYTSGDQKTQMEWRIVPNELPQSVLCEYRDLRETPPRVRTFQPMSEGGMVIDGKTPDTMEFVSAERLQNPVELTENAADRSDTAIRTHWKATAGDRTYDVVYTMTVLGKTLVMDVVSATPGISEIRFGKLVEIDQSSPTNATPVESTDSTTVETTSTETVVVQSTDAAETTSAYPKPRVITVPYLVGDYGARPGIAVLGDAAHPLFLSGFGDHCRSNASAFFFENSVTKKDGKTLVVYNGGAKYIPKTNGEMNPCCERFFVTLSDDFDETLPNIPNPKSPWMQATAERVWIAHGASMNRENDYNTWKRFHRYGMEKILITDHEVGWRDGGESFTFRTRSAPGKGGDENQAWYARAVQELGYRYGIYNNYTDFGPVNEFWSEDMITRLPDGNLRGAWARCYNPKPSQSVVYEAKLAPQIQEKFHLSTAYCDVHTAVRPWEYVDFDARVPGAATFASTFYNYGEIMLHQKQTWGPGLRGEPGVDGLYVGRDDGATDVTGGPVYSEGNNHWYYVGLTDGNYGQDQAYDRRIPNNAWLVNFDLLKMHPLGTSFGMGNPGMFYGDGVWGGFKGDERIVALDRFIAATLAFGHTGFFVTESLPFAARSYFLLQQIQKRYAVQTVQSIQYVGENGKLYSTSQAISNGAYQRNQMVTQYEDLTVVVNGNTTETLVWDVSSNAPKQTDASVSDAANLKQTDASSRTNATSSDSNVIELPPNGWIVLDPSKRVTAWSRNVDGHRADYVESSAYLYADGRGHLTRFPKAICDGQLIVMPRSEAWKNAADKAPRVETQKIERSQANLVEVIPMGCQILAIATEGKAVASVEALNDAGERIGSAEFKVSERGFVYITPKTDAASYLVTWATAVTESLPNHYRAAQKAVAGQTVTIQKYEEARSPETINRQIPADAVVGTLCWIDCEEGTANAGNHWMEFLIVPYAEFETSLSNPTIHNVERPVSLDVRVKVNLAETFDAAVPTPPALRVTLTPVTVDAQTTTTTSAESELSAKSEAIEIPATTLQWLTDAVQNVPSIALATVVIPETYCQSGSVYRIELVVTPTSTSSNATDSTATPSPFSQTCSRWIRTAERHVEIVAWDWSTIESRWLQFRGAELKPMEAYDRDTGATADMTSRACGGVTKTCLFTHPPYMGGTGATSVRFRPMTLSAEIPAMLEGVVGKADASDPGDGIRFEIWAITSDGNRTRLSETTVTKHEWVPITADLSAFTGQTICIELVADAGERNDSSGDWACWADFSLTSCKLLPVTELSEKAFE